jgi:cellulose synthase/poly-beta-1,6-N-acetylglucosamine synthase-like glycosyltransferase
MATLEALFWIGAGVVLYTYIGYPVLLIFLACLHQTAADIRFAAGRRERRRRSDRNPSVSLVFAAHNEAAVIEEKMRNAATSDYPPDCLELLIGCDACTDETAQLARQADLPNCRVIEFDERAGKAAVLNRLVGEARGEVVVFCDANTILMPDAIGHLVRHFASEDEGCVCGELRLLSWEGNPQNESMYWRYETFLKFLESRLNMLVGANGGLFAIRRDLFQPLPRHAVIEDFVIAMRIRATGRRILYDPEAIACEAAAHPAQEFRRRVRIGAGNFLALKYTWRMLNPAAGRIALAYWSHKILRWSAPVAIALSFIAALTLVSKPFYAACAGALLVIALLAACEHRLLLAGKSNRLLSIPYYFLSMNLALLLGLIRYLRGTQTLVWAPTVRSEVPQKDARV